MTQDTQALLETLESDRQPTEVYRFRGPFRNHRSKVLDEGDTPSDALMAEEIAFTFHPAGSGTESEWGIYFGPAMAWESPTGEREYSPPLERVTPEVMEYWRNRAAQCAHPLMQARYADLLWDLPRALDHSEPDHQMARIAIDAYTQAALSRLHEHHVWAIRSLQRALDIALSLKAKAQIQTCAKTLWQFEREVAEDESLGLWGFSFDRLLLERNDLIAVPESLERALVKDLEDRAARLAAKGPQPLPPFALEAAATRLAQYYRRSEMHDDLRRVMNLYASVVQNMDPSASPMIRSRSLENLYDQLRSFGLHEEAHSLSEAIQASGRQSVDEMKTLAVSHKISNREVEEFFASMLAGDTESVLTRISVHFIPSKERVEQQVRSLAQEAPLTYLMQTNIKDYKGRTVARIGPLNRDPEGHLIRQIAQNLQLGGWWLREVVARAIDRGILTEELALKRLLGGLLFDEKQETILQTGLQAYWRHDSVSAIHVLVPQIERAVRELAALVGSPLFSRRSRGGLQYRTLERLLQDEGVAGALGDDLVAYLTVLLTDPRGWNLRNRACHGLLPSSALTMEAADRIFHALLALTLMEPMGPLGILSWFFAAVGLTWKEIADVVGCSSRSLRRWRREGEVPEGSVYHGVLGDLMVLRGVLLATFGADEGALGDAREWLRKGHERLDGRTPLAVWSDGDRQTVIDVLEAGPEH